MSASKVQQPIDIHDAYRQRLLARAGIPDLPRGRFVASPELFARLRESEWSKEFEEKMRVRMVMGACRYATLAAKKLKPGHYDLITPIKKKIELYNQTGNTEYLVDIANYCLIAYECDDHPLKHFHALDDHHDHCQTKKK